MAPRMSGRACASDATLTPSMASRRSPARMRPLDDAAPPSLRDCTTQAGDSTHPIPAAAAIRRSGAKFADAVVGQMRAVVGERRFISETCCGLAAPPATSSVTTDSRPNLVASVEVNPSRLVGIPLEMKSIREMDLTTTVPDFV